MNEEEKEVIEKLKFRVLQFNKKEDNILLSYINKLETKNLVLEISNRNLLNAYNNKTKEVIALKDDINDILNLSKGDIL